MHKKFGWKTTIIQHPKYGNIRVTHWANGNEKYKIDPRELLQTIETNKNIVYGKDERLAATPILKQVPFGKYMLAARHYRKGRNNVNWPASYLFKQLKNTVDRKIAIVEMPVALVEYPFPRLSSEAGIHDTILVSLWKKKTRCLHAFLGDENVAVEKKQLAVHNAVKKIARLHANGFVHGHLRPENMVINEKGETKFVDYTLLQSLGGLHRLTGNTEKAREINYFLNNIKMEQIFSQDSEKQLLSHFSLQRELMQEYKKEYENLKKRKQITKTRHKLF